MADGHNDIDPELLQAYLDLDRQDNDEALAAQTTLDRAKALRAFNPGPHHSALGGMFGGIAQVAAAAGAKAKEGQYKDQMQNANIQRQATGLDIIDRLAKARQVVQPGQEQPLPTDEERTPPFLM